ncbi:MAG: hypothetical protein KDK39_06580 [Leptospiraceae bacterium]|nr:hypothetical protein [Leptospiraceae bacterium]
MRLWLSALILLWGIGVVRPLRAEGPEKNSPAGDSECWTQIEIQEAFISRETHRVWRDVFSEAEFGWVLQYGPARERMGRISLYGSLFFPECRLEGAFERPDQLQLTLIERDVFRDDRVASQNLKPGQARVDFNQKRDWARLSWQRFLPNLHSGRDATPTGAQVVRDQYNGSVDFLAQDATDYLHSGFTENTWFLYQPLPGIRWQISGDQTQSWPLQNEAAHSRFVLLQGRSIQVRLQAPPGTGRKQYQIRALSSRSPVDVYTAAVQLAAGLRHYHELRQLCAVLQSYSASQPQADVQADFATFAYQRLQLQDQKRTPLPVDSSRVLLALALYESPKETHRSFVQQRFHTESESYRDLLESIHKKSLEKTTPDSKTSQMDDPGILSSRVVDLGSRFSDSLAVEDRQNGY